MLGLTPGELFVVVFIVVAVVSFPWWQRAFEELFVRFSKSGPEAPTDRPGAEKGARGPEGPL